MSGAETLLTIAWIWLVLGAVTALVFLAYGVDRVLESARDVYLFRVLVAPGVILIWPLVLWRWRQLERGGIAWRDHHQPHRKLAGIIELAMAACLFVLLILAITIGTHSPFPEPVKLSALTMAGGLG